MENAFVTLGLPQRLSLTEEEVRSAYFARCKEASSEKQEALNAAKALLESPDRRLKHFMELAAPGEARQWRAVSMPDHLMALFMEVGQQKQQADALLAKRDAAQTALAKAVLQPSILAARDKMESLATALSDALERQTASLEALDEALSAGEPATWEKIASAQAHLAYLVKWQSQVRELLLTLA